VPPPNLPTPPPTVPSSTDTGNPTGTNPETLTVQHGGNTLSMTGPDSQGIMQLTKQDGTGRPKTYDIAFGHGTTATATPTPAPTATPAAASTGADGVQQVTPGADGTAVIHDGKTTITAQEQPGGEVKVTVDDGSGQPTTYTLDHAGQPTTTSTADPMAASPATPATPVAAAPMSPATPVATPAMSPADTATPVAAPAMSPAGTATPVAASATLASDTTQQPGFTTQQPGFTDPSAMPQTTLPTSAGDPGALVGGTDNSGFAQGFSDPSSSFGNALGGAVGGGHAAAAFFGPHHDTNDMLGPGHPGVAGTDVTPIGQPGDAGLASAPDSALDHGQQGQPSQLGGMPMMGGMGGGGGQGGDQQRGPNQWRTQGQLFDDSDDVVGRFSGTLDDGR
jgi:hypothetical protein